MTLAIAVFFCVCVVVGAGLSHLIGVALRLEERIAFGAVIGVMVVTTTGFLAGAVLGFGQTSVVAGALIGLVASTPGWSRGATDVVPELQDFGRRLRTPLADRRNPGPLLVLLAVAWPYTVRVLQLAYQRSPSGGLLAGHLSVFGDWQTHLAYTGSFVYADNHGLDLTTAAGHDLAYYFGVDYFAAMLAPLGASLPASLQLSTGFLAFAFPAVMYLAGLRIFGYRSVALGGTVLFLMAGGWGFWQVWDDARAAGGLEVLWNLPRDYTRDFDTYWLDNPVLGHLYPQRPTLVGFAVALIATALLWTARDRAASGRDAAATFAFVGVLVGLTPMFHIFGWGAAMLLAGAWALLDRRREWLWFLVPAVGLAVVPIVWMLPEESSFRWAWGWVAGDRPDEIAVFWFRNTGLFVPLLVAAMVWRDVVDRRLAVGFAPIWLLFIGPHLAIPHPWEGNSTKYLVFWWMFGAFFVAALLIELASRSRALSSAAAVVGVSLVASGGLDLWKAADATGVTFPTEVMSGGDLAVAGWVIENTDTDAIFVSATDNRSAIPALTGRPVVSAFEGWIFSLGVQDWAARVADTQTILRGDAGAADALARYDVDYVVIGPLELAVEGADTAYWDARAPIVYDFGGYRVYDVAQDLPA